MAFEPACRLSEIPGKGGLRVRLGSLELGLYRVGERVFAMENVCPHAGHPLHEGWLEGAVIHCAAHGWPFDLETGCLADAGGESVLARYAVRIDGDTVLVDPDETL